jgi:hypothetical protein
MRDITKHLPSLDYWIAKDLGLPDDILHNLKYRLINKGEMPEAVRVVHTAERCQLSILLFKQSMISSREVNNILRSHGVLHLNLLHKLQFTEH